MLCKPLKSPSNPPLAKGEAKPGPLGFARAFLSSETVSFAGVAITWAQDTYKFNHLAAYLSAYGCAPHPPSRLSGPYSPPPKAAGKLAGGTAARATCLAAQPPRLIRAPSCQPLPVRRTISWIFSNCGRAEGCRRRPCVWAAERCRVCRCVWQTPRHRPGLRF